MRDFDYTYLAEALDKEGHVPAIQAEASAGIMKMRNEIWRLQDLVYLTPSRVKSLGKYLMFRTDDPDNIDGIRCDIAQGPDNNFYLIGDGTPSSVQCQNVLTLDSEVRFQKID